MNPPTNTLPNSQAVIEHKVSKGQIHLQGQLGMLFSRLVLFAVCQAIFAVGFAFSGKAHPWQASSAWWPVSATISNLINLFLLNRMARREGMQFKDLFRVGQHSFWRELLICLGVFVVSAPLSVVPNIALGNLLFGDVNVASELFFRPMKL